MSNKFSDATESAGSSADEFLAELNVSDAIELLNKVFKCETRDDVLDTLDRVMKILKERDSVKLSGGDSLPSLKSARIKPGIGDED